MTVETTLPKPTLPEPSEGIKTGKPSRAGYFRDRYEYWQSLGPSIDLSEGEFEEIYAMAVRDVIRLTGKLSPQLELMRRYISIVDGEL